MQDDQAVRIEDITTLAHEKGKLTRVTFRQRRRDGSWQQRKREVYDNGNSATVLPYDPERKTVLLTRQLRVPIYLQDGLQRTIEACAGKLDGEQAETRIIKEMEEELGYRIARVERLFALYVSPAAVAEKIEFFTCNYSPADKVSAGGGLADEGEDIEVIETTLENAAAMIASGEIIDAKTVVLVQWLAGVTGTACRR
ncbi:MAG TPA: NUDIX domain-containing protein [Bradyrhizobium sp.]|nr:NUDIX domain-containing protein [Bradyrhizobium sp.]